MKKSWMRSRFVMIVAVVVVLNLGLDLATFFQAQKMDVTGDEVNVSHSVINRLDKVQIAFLRQVSAALPVNLDAEMTSLAQLIPAAPDAAPDFAELKSQIQQLQSEALPVGEMSEGRLLSLIEKMRDQQMEVLVSRLREDQSEGVVAKYENIVSVTVDLLVIALMAVMFWTEKRAHLATERSLLKTIDHLDSTKDSLMKSDIFKNQLLRTAAHDLKNPLGSIRGFAELIHDDPMDRASIVEMSETIRRITDSTLELVDSLVNSEALKKNHVALDRKSMDIIECIEETCEYLQVMASAKNQLINWTLAPESLLIEMDGGKFRDALSNIIGNAVKFSPSASKIEVRSQIVGGEFQISVDDQGPGFTAGDKEKAFHFGQKLSARPTAGETSTGIGLYSAKQNIELHKGRVRIADNPSGGGTRFEITIPLPAPDTAPSMQI